MTEHRHDAVTNELVDGAPVLEHRFRYSLPILRQKLGNGLRLGGFAQLREGAKIDEHHHCASPGEGKTSGIVLEFRDYAGREKPSQHLAPSFTSYSLGKNRVVLLCKQVTDEGGEREGRRECALGTEHGPFAGRHRMQVSVHKERDGEQR